MRKVFLFAFAFYAFSAHAQNTLPTTGNVGIGILTPTALTHIYQTGTSLSTPTLFVQDFSATPADGKDVFKVLGRYNAGNSYLMRVQGNNGSLPAFAINDVGAVGIGKENPDAFTHIFQTGAYLSVPTLLVQDNSEVPITGKDVFKIVGRDNTGNSYLFRVLGNNGIINGITVTDEGLIGLGTNSPTEKLTIEGNAYVNGNLSAYGLIKTKKVMVTQTLWPDYVFDENYTLRNLASLERYIGQNKHLPDVPSAKEVEANGVDLGDTQALLLKKIEELTLYVISQQKQISIQNKRIKALESKHKK